MSEESDARLKLDDLRSRLEGRNLRFQPTMPVSDVADFESRHGIDLPWEYKLFLTHVGNGGDGPPHYGLCPPGHTESWFNSDETSCWVDFERITQPFPLEQALFLEDDNAIEPELEARVWDGSIYLGTDGCGMNWALVVSGPQKGFVWQFNDMGITPCLPPMTFLQWFCRWLDHDPESETPFWWEKDEKAH